MSLTSTGLTTVCNYTIFLYQLFIKKLAHKGRNDEGALEKNLADMALTNSPNSALVQTRGTKRRSSPEISTEKSIDIAFARQLCIDGKIYELIDISNVEVSFPCIHPF
jgi:hypothetical protein